jgi:subtilisin family serine protease
VLHPDAKIPLNPPLVKKGEAVLQFFQASRGNTMNRKNRSIFVSVLLLTLAGLLIAKVVANDDPATSALSGVATSATGNATPPANTPATLERNKNRLANASKGERNTTQVANAGQAKNSAANPDGSSTKNTATPENKSTASSAAHQLTEAITKLTPLEPRAEPYALVANSGSVNVRFSVRTIGGSNQTAAVFLRQSGMPEGIALNDLGMDGDLVAGDHIYGTNIVMDTSRLQPDSCLSYEAFISDGGSDSVSSPLRLCVSSFPVRIAESNLAEPITFPDGIKAVPDEILVRFTPDTSATTIRKLLAEINATVVGSLLPDNLYQARLSTAVSAEHMTALINKLRVHSEVAKAYANALGAPASTPIDPEFPKQHGLQRIRANDVWDAGATGSGIIVAVLDTGIDRTHPDFGTVGDCQLADNDCGSSNTDYDTGYGHGTAVAGVIAAKTNNNPPVGLGVAGVAPGSKIHSIRIGTTTSWNLALIRQGFLDARAYGLASVINASLYVGPLPPVDLPSPALDVGDLCASVNAAVFNGVTPVAIVVNAAANFGSNGNYYPARCNGSSLDSAAAIPLHNQLAVTNKKYFITVANSISDTPPPPPTSTFDSVCANATLMDQRCGGTSTGVLYTSNYGDWVDIAAPGMSIQSTRSSAIGGGYARYTGTSFSAPMVSGAAAILLQCGVPLDQIESTLKNSAIVTVPFPDGSSAPRLDIYQALLSRDVTPTAVNLSNNSLNNGTDTTGGVEVGTLTPTDPDTCDKHTYSIAAGFDAAKFSIPTASNRLILADGVLNYTAKSSYKVVVQVKDYFNKTYDQTLTVTVNSSATNHAPNISNQSFNINENSVNGTAVGTVSANDPDAGNTISYSITAGNTGGAFALNATTGALTVSNTLSYATTQTYALTVKVTDNGGLFASATVTINVNNPAAANNPPNISAQTFSVSESSSNGTAVGTIAASDPDGDSLSYSITAGNTGGAFALNTTTGALTVSNPLSNATKPSYALTVKVTDNGGLSASATVTVNVNAASTPPPAPANPPASSGGGGGGCSVMPVGARPDSSLALAVLVLLGYGVRRRILRRHGKPSEVICSEAL